MKKRTIVFLVIMIFFLFFGMNQNLSAQVAEQDSLALVALYDSTGGTNWTNNTNWLTGPVATWFGITVEDDRVRYAALSNNNLIGTIPPEIGDITKLSELNLSSNQLSGIIPTEIRNLTNLIILSCNVNQLTGSIPNEIGNLTNLVRINIGSNQLSGEIPPDIGNLTNLTHLYLQSNQLSGSIPNEIGNMINLEVLNLSSNQLSETIPHEIDNLINLVSINISLNQLSGEIPPDIGNLENLSSLSLMLNDLSGAIPNEIGNLTNLTHLVLFSNQLSGSIPDEIGNMTNLIVIYLQSNQLTNSIPSEIGNISSLEKLSLHNNHLSGSIPLEIGNLTKLQQLSLYNNEFTGLPNVSSIPTLIDLQIQNNQLTFEDIEPNIGVPGFTYAPQDSVGEKQVHTVPLDSSLTFSIAVGGTNNLYQWLQNDAAIPGATDTTYTIDPASEADAGFYICEISNTIATELTLYSRPINVFLEGFDLETDSLALVALYNSTDGANWIDNTNWLSGPVSTWYGITVSNGRVTEISLNENNLVGIIPSEVGNLTKLVLLILSSNQLSGSIPSEIGNLINLNTLNLFRNQLVSSIPNELGNLINLNNLSLGNNQLIGNIPIEMGNLTKLTYLYLGGNQLSGSIPPELGNLIMLGGLYLTSNQLTGQIPSEISDLTNLTRLHLDNNQLSGAIPQELFNVINLTQLRLHNNQLTGAISPEFSNLNNLTLLTINNNQLSGSIPTELSQLSNLEYLFLNGNQLSESIPSELGSLSDLKYLYLMDNQLTGSVSNEICNLTNLERLYLDRNQLTGVIPAEITNLNKLVEFHIYNNLFFELPDLSMITTLNELQIQNNKFTFEDIEPNIEIPIFLYSPQDSVGDEQDTTIIQGSGLTFFVSVTGTANQYQWTRDGEDISGSNSSSYNIDSAESSDAGSYICKITNTIATELTLYRRPINVTVEGESGIIDQTKQIPTDLSLGQNYPNPFNPTTTIEFSIKERCLVQLKIYDVRGRLLSIPVKQEHQPGNYRINFNARNLPSGIYFYQIKMKDFMDIKKMVVLE